jgi:hypothetical protein
MTDTNPVRPFSDFLRVHNVGETDDQLAEAFRDLIGRVKDTGKPGTVTLTIKVEPVKGAPSDCLGITDTIKLSLPDRVRNGGVYFTDRANNVAANDPRQLAGLDIDPVTGEVLDAKNP